MAGRVLHVLSQRPSLTGSGVTLDALVRHAALAGWDQWVVVGTPAEDPHPAVADLPAQRIRPLCFGTAELPFPLPGMSDVMPYPSTRFSSMTRDQLAAYREAWRGHLASVIAEARPQVIHAHHVWIFSALVKQIAPRIPVVTHCHATGLRQLALCPHLADEVRGGCAQNERFAVLHQGHADALAQALGVPAERIHLVSAGYRADLFHPRGRRPADNSLLYIGKYSAAKGLPWLLDAVEALWAQGAAEPVLHVAGSGAGDEADDLARRMRRLGGRVRLHGQLRQPELAELMRGCAVCVLPSLYEGVPLVLAEAMACGCGLVATALPGVVEQLAPHLDPALELVPLPRLVHTDRPAPEEVPAFVGSLIAAIRRALARPPLGTGPELERQLRPLSWQAVFQRVEAVWRELVSGRPPGC